MSRDRFKALIGMLHVVDPGVEDGHDKLHKVTGFLQFFKEKNAIRIVKPMHR